jgi:hypothetical protein
MRALTPERVLDVWERGRGCGLTVRALALLSAAEPEAAWESLGALPLGERDRRLLALREEMLGRAIDGVADCPACGEPLDLALDARDLRSDAAGGPLLEQVSHDGLELRFRPADSHDLLAAERCSGVEEARRLLAGRCLLEARRDGLPVTVADLPDEALEVLAAALAEADPGAELLLDLRCPSCGHAWWELLDVASFFWAELEVQAVRLLQEVHILARAYGWREADILALSPRRRRIYLDLVGA